MCGPIFLIVFMTPALSKATQVTYDLDTTFPGYTGSTPWLRATFDDTGQPLGTVLLTLYASGIAGSEFVGGQGNSNNWGWFFNINAGYDAQLGNLSIVWHSGDNLSPDIKIGVAPDAFKAGGDGYFDIAFAWPESADRFLPEQTDVYNFWNQHPYCMGLRFLECGRGRARSLLYSSPFTGRRKLDRRQ